MNLVLLQRTARDDHGCLMQKIIHAFFYVMHLDVRSDYCRATCRLGATIYRWFVRPITYGSCSIANEWP